MLKNKFLMAFAVAAAAGSGPVLASQATSEISSPAAKSDDYRPRTDVLIDNLNQLSGAIATARKNGTVTPAEAQTLRADMQSTRQAISQHSSHGMTRTEFQELAQRVNAIRTKLRLERVDFDRAPA